MSNHPIRTYGLFFGLCFFAQIAFGQSPQLFVTPGALDFGANIVSLQIVIQNSGVGTLSWNVTGQVTAFPNDQRLIAKPNAGTTTNELDTVRIDLIRAGMPQGAYDGIVSVNSNGGLQNVLVRFDASVPILSIIPPALGFDSVSNGLVININNLGIDSLVWAAIAFPNWISTIPSNGQTFSVPDQVMVFVDRSNFHAGQYTGTVTITSNGGVDSTKIFVTANPPSIPVLGPPPNGAVNVPIIAQLTWNQSSGASKYHLQVATDVGFSNLVYNNSTLDITQQTVGPLVNSTVYFWHVAALGSGGISSFSPIRNFITIVAAPLVPTLISPSDGATSQPVTIPLSWNPSSGATSYRLQLSQDPVFGNPLFDNPTISGTTQNVGPLLHDATYYWRVSASNVGGPSSFSAPRQFTTIGLPQLFLSPVSVDFGNIELGLTANQTTILKNTGTAPLVVDSVRILSVGGTDFMFGGYSGPFPPIAPTDSIAITVAFSPGTIGAKQGTLIVHSNTATSPDSVILTGSGLSSLFGVSFKGDTLSGNQMNVSITPPGSFSTSSAIVYYRNAGRAAYDSLVLSLSAGNFIGDLPPSIMNIRGVEYFVTLQTANGVLTFPRINPDSNPAILRVKIANVSSPTIFQRHKYMMVSVPLDLAQPNIFQQLSDDYGGYRQNLWRVFRWENNIYVEYPNIRVSLNPGNSFWLVTHGGKSFTIDSGKSVTSFQPYAIALQPGWNQIANPFAYPVAWTSITATGSIKGPYYFDGNDYQINPSGTLKPWEGYFVFNEQSSVVILTVPTVEGLGSAAPTTLPLSGENNRHYFLRFSAEISANETYKRHAVVGLDNIASFGNDIYDYPEPPSIVEGLLFSIVDREKKFIQNVKPYSPEGQCWLLRLASPVSEAIVNVMLTEFGELPEGFHVYLLDKSRGMSVVINDHRAVLQLGNTNVQREFEVIVGTKQYAETQSGGIPLEPTTFRLEQNYPNPFNPETIIQYQIEERGSVLLEVFNMLGQKILTLVREDQQAGHYSVRWNGATDYNQLVSSGVYLYRLTSGKNIAIRKLLLLR